jgi:hypothetical protein
VGFKQRERKRRAKAAASHAQRQSRQSGSSTSKHWLTPLLRTACCATPECRKILRAGSDAIYRHAPLEVLCQPCADRAGLFYRPSLRWVKENRRRRQTRLAA